MNDPVEWGKNIAVMVKGYVGKAVEALTGRMDALEQKLTAIPSGKDGADGKDGKDGSDGAPGKDADPITAEQLADALKAMPEVLDTAVASYLAANPPPAGKDGIDGINGKDAEPISEEQIGKAVASHIALNPPRAGRDGRDGQPGLAGKDGQDGTNGKDGANGLDLKNFDATLADDGRTLTLKLADAEREMVRAIPLPIVIDRGVYRPENAYAKGDGVTYGGSFWIAQTDAPGSKPDGGEGWRLAVKKGRDGRDGERGKDYAPPAPVRVP